MISARLAGRNRAQNRARVGHIACAVASLVLLAGRLAGASTLPPGFQETTIFAGLSSPTVVKFAPDGRVFVAEKGGLIKVFASVNATTFTIFADLRLQVHDFWDRGLLGMELDPSFPTRPYVYVLYALDKNPADPTSTIPTWGDGCPTPPGATGSGCTILGRLSRLNASAPWPVQSTEQILIESFPQQFPSHSVGGLAFGADGALYVTVGDGASFLQVDFGQLGGTNGAGPGQKVPVNPLGDPPVGIGGAQVPPDALGGALRAQSVRRPAGMPATLNGALLRVNPDTGAALPDNPLAGSADPNAQRIVAYGFRNPFRFAIRPGTRETWVGDVGWVSIEEINRFDVSNGVAANFGWPCYEGMGPQTSFAATGLTTCLTLYAEGSARTPIFSYDHSAQVVPGDACTPGSSAITGLAFYTTGAYPASYRGALFFADWARKCIWAMLPDASGAPDPTRVIPFATGLSGGAVHLERGPGGDLFYADYDLGRIQRVSFFSGNMPPVPTATATPNAGPSPLLVQFDASGTIDPEGTTLSYFWDLDGDEVFDDSTDIAPTWTFDTSGKHTASVVARDAGGAAALARVDVYVDDQAPHASIVSPAASLNWKVGDPIFFSGIGSDPEEGTLPPSAMEWTLIVHHCPSNCHSHTVQSWSGVAAGSFGAPDHEYPSYLELILTVTDSVGLSDTTTISLQPKTVELSFATDPPGLVLAVGAESGTTPFSRTVIAGSTNSVTAVSPQFAGSEQYGFKLWSDGGEATHVVVAPSVALTLTATFRPFASLTLTQTVTRAVKGGRATLSATVTNNGPAVATEVVLSETLPQGASLISSTPPGACTGTGRSVVCNVPSIALGGSENVTMTIRPLIAGVLPLTGKVTAFQADLNSADNLSTINATVRPFGDLNADGQPDILWRQATTGVVAAWLMNGPTMVGLGFVTPSRGPDLNWRVGGIGDFDADGRFDIIWQNRATGVFEIWLMDGFNRKAVVPLFTAPDVTWQMVGTADFNADGWPDLLMRHPTGLNLVIRMNGTAISTGTYLTTVVDPTWQLVGASDMNSDGKPDLVWHRTTAGTNTVWLMNGYVQTGVMQLYSNPDPNWLVVSLIDLNTDHRTDLTLRNQVTGQEMTIHIIDGVTVGGTMLQPATDVTWGIVGPK